MPNAVAVPLIVTVPPEVDLSRTPAGSDPALIDHVYGAVPPVAVQLAEYGAAFETGPVVGVQFTVNPGGATVPEYACVAACGEAAASRTRTV